jgi:hypothetical protein
MAGALVLLQGKGEGDGGSKNMRLVPVDEVKGIAESKQLLCRTQARRCREWFTNLRATSICRFWENESSSSGGAEGGGEVFGYKRH